MRLKTQCEGCQRQYPLKGETHTWPQTCLTFMICVDRETEKDYNQEDALRRMDGDGND